MKIFYIKKSIIAAALAGAVVFPLHAVAFTTSQTFDDSMQGKVYTKIAQYTGGDFDTGWQNTNHPDGSVKHKMEVYSIWIGDFSFMKGLPPIEDTPDVTGTITVHLHDYNNDDASFKADIDITLENLKMNLLLKCNKSDCLIL